MNVPRYLFVILLFFVSVNIPLNKLLKNQSKSNSIIYCFKGG
jgi:hypothetical protein